MLIVGGKDCSSSGHPVSFVMIGFLVVMEAEIWIPDQISDVPMGCKSAVSSVATFLPITDGHVAWPLWVWKASSRGQCLNFCAALSENPRVPLRH